MNMFTSVCMVISVIILVKTSAQQPFIATNYTIRSLSNATYLSSAVKTFAQTQSAIACGVKCSQLALVSFFFVKQSALCYCNDDVDPAIVSSTNGGHIKYGYIAGAASPTTIPTPTAPNWSTPLFPTCDYSGTSSNWIVFQRRMDGSVDFYRNWTDYVNGFGNANGEYWLGLETLHQHTANGCKLCIYMEAGPNNISTVESGHAQYSYFSVASSVTNYTLLIDGFSGTLGIDDSLAYHNGCSFTTYDKDHDQLAGNCAVTWEGAFWYLYCYTVNLNGRYMGGEHQNHYGTSVEWSDPWGQYLSLWKTEMSFACN